MRFYARPSFQLVRQVVGDLMLVAWLVGWWFVGRFTDGVVRAIAEPGRQAARLGAQVEEQLTEAANQAAGVPLVGDGLRQPLDGLAGSVDAMTAQTLAQVASIELAATVIGWVVFAVPALVMLALWVPRRLAFARRASETLSLYASADGAQLLALRALATQPLAVLQGAASDPVAGWRAGDPDTIARLAQLELAASGVGVSQRRLKRLAASR